MAELQRKLDNLTRPQKALKFTELKLHHRYPLRSLEESSFQSPTGLIESIAATISFAKNSKEAPTPRRIYLPKRFEEIKENISQINREIQSGTPYFLKWLGAQGSTNIVSIESE